MRKECIIDGCQSVSKSRKMCQRHYVRWRHYGDPLFNYNAREQVIARFWKQVDKSHSYGPWGNCWKFMGFHIPSGYGRHSAGGPKWECMAHRFAYWIQFGDIPAGIHILHSCDVRDCVNPDHLRQGTPADNARDRVSRGRSCKGSDSPKAKLTEEKVAVIRERIANGETAIALSKEYGVSNPIISRICTRKIWTHV